MDPEKENKQYLNQPRIKKKELNDELVKSIKVIPGDHKSHLGIEKRKSMFRSTGGVLFEDSPWFSELQQPLMSNAALEGYFYNFILVYHL